MQRCPSGTASGSTVDASERSVQSVVGSEFFILTASFNLSHPSPCPLYTPFSTCEIDLLALPNTLSSSSSSTQIACPSSVHGQTCPVFNILFNRHVLLEEILWPLALPTIQGYLFSWRLILLSVNEYSWILTQSWTTNGHLLGKNKVCKRSKNKT